ncbi:MAG: GIY-YIG nuclease family protein [Clostridia bacterium]|nr:GIY-YIG nuclease family protein [Clostridia bacterium]
MRNSYVYILANQNNTTLYIGVTSDIYRRMNEHNDKVVDGFTKKYKVNKLVYIEEYGSIKEAIAREKQLKGWRREKKEALINSMNPEWKDLIRES